MARGAAWVRTPDRCRLPWAAANISAMSIHTGRLGSPFSGQVHIGPSGPVLADHAPPLGVEIRGLDVRTLDGHGAAELAELIRREKLVVLRDQPLTEAEFVAFARNLGQPVPYFQEHYRHPDHPEIFVSASALLDGKKIGVRGTGCFWHSDYSFRAEPLAMTMIRPVLLPKRPRQTWFVDMARVLRELPAPLAAIARERRAFHDAADYYKVQPWDRDKAICELVAEFHAIAPGAWHPMVIEHPTTGAEALFVSRGFTRAVEGMAHEEGRAFLAQLFAFCERDANVHRHTWAIDDLLVWDNRCLIHRAGPAEGGAAGAADGGSISFRISVQDGLPF